MSQHRFSPWLVLGMVGVAASLIAVSLAGGVFLGYQWGRAAASAAQPERGLDPQSLLPSIPLPDFAPFAETPAAQPYLGIRYEPVTAALAEAEGLPVAEG